MEGDLIEMVTYIIFSQEELINMMEGDIIEDEANHIYYVSEEGYRKLHEKWAEENNQRWD